MRKIRKFNEADDSSYLFKTHCDEIKNISMDLIDLGFDFQIDPLKSAPHLYQLYLRYSSPLPHQFYYKSYESPNDKMDIGSVWEDEFKRKSELYTVLSTEIDSLFNRFKDHNCLEFKIADYVSGSLHWITIDCYFDWKKVYTEDKPSPYTYPK